jgi:uncharacterized integral membrane protein
MTFITLHLHLLEHPRRKHMFLNNHATSIAPITGHNMAILGSSSLARITNLLLLNEEVDLAPIVEIPQRQRRPHFHVRSATVSRRVARVSAPAEESREQIEWVVTTAGCLTFAVLLHSVVTVLVVYFAQRAGREYIVGVCYFDEFLAGCIIAAKRWVSNCIL